MSYVSGYVYMLFNAIHSKAKIMSRKRNEAIQINTLQPEEIDFDIHQQAIAETAYYKAEKRGFIPGYETQDWVEAEAEYFSRTIGGTET